MATLQQFLMVVNSHPFERIQALKEYDQFTFSVSLRRDRFRQPGIIRKLLAVEVEIFKKGTFDEIKNTTEWNSFKIIGQLGDELGEYHDPCDVLCDRFSQNILVCDNGNRRVQVRCF